MKINEYLNLNAFSLNANDKKYYFEKFIKDLIFHHYKKSKEDKKILDHISYDFKNNGITYTQLRFERDLLSWRMNFSWIPFSANKQWNFFIGIKSGMLSDIKYDKRRQRDKIL